MNAAILMTCHNRKEKTLECLESIFQPDSKTSFSLSVFLVDDGSTDGTGAAVLNNFPTVKVINGSGTLFWNKGMRLAWKTAVQTQEFEFYIWLNDDTVLDKNALQNLYDNYKEACEISNNEVLISAACRARRNSEEFSYGGRNDLGPVIPNGTLQTCKYINGNLVLVPNKIFNKLGFLDSNYTHGIGDFDYGLRAEKNDFKCYTTKNYIATCPPNNGIPGWCNPENSLKERWILLHSPLGLNIKEYNHFRKRFWGRNWFFFAFKAYAKMLNPQLYNKLS